jgi:hypothetical protein
MGVFWTDYQTGETQRVSIASNGTQGNNWCGRIVPSLIPRPGKVHYTVTARPVEQAS